LDSKTRLFLAFNVLMVVTALSLFVGFLLPILLESLGRDMTFSGRTQIWGAVIDSVRKRPFLGYGFYGFWLGTKGESSVIITKLHWVFGYAHNGILEIAVQLGVVGVMLFLATLLQAIYHAWICLKTGKFTEVHFYISILLLTILYNIDEVTVLWPNDLLSILYIVACCGLARAADEVRLRDRASTHRKFAFAPRVGAKIAASKELM
jgi:exopolysaccharide production protein ExoQ